MLEGVLVTLDGPHYNSDPPPPLSEVIRRLGASISVCGQLRARPLLRSLMGRMEESALMETNYKAIIVVTANVRVR